jgi:hypothetical protein
MAIIKFGALVVGARGTIGGVTYSANKSGPYARAWGHGSNPRTVAQSITRADMGGLGARWLAISSSERDDWDSFAADAANELTNSLGETYFLSGWQWFAKTRLFGGGAESPDEFPPSLPRLSTPAGITLTCDVGPPEEAILDTNSQFDGRVGYVDGALLQRPTQNYNDRNWRSIATIVPPPDDWDIAPQLSTAFGPMQSGTRYILRAWRRSLLFGAWCLTPLIITSDVP